MRLPQVQPKIKFSLLASIKRNEEKPRPIWSLNPLALARGFASIPQPHFRPKKIMHGVIGSGPAGVACAKALLARGANMLMLDAGLELEPA